MRVDDFMMSKSPELQDYWTTGLRHPESSYQDYMKHQIHGYILKPREGNIGGEVDAPICVIRE